MTDDRPPRETPDGLTAGLDVALAVLAAAAGMARVVVVRPASAAAHGARRLGNRLPALDSPRMADLAGRGEELRRRVERAAVETFGRLVRGTVEAALAAIDLTQLIRGHVDLDAVAEDLDVDAVIARADINAVVARTDLDAALGGLDLDSVAARVDLDAVLARVDLDAVVGRVDLNEVASRVDLDAILSRVDLNEVASRIDLDAILAHVDLNEVASRIDLDAILAHVDLNEVAARVDLDAVVQRIQPDALVARVDIEAVLDRLDLATIAREVIDAIDLPDIVRQSSGAASSQAARVVRAEGMHADDSVARFVDRMLRRSAPRPLTP